MIPALVALAATAAVQSPAAIQTPAAVPADAPAAVGTQIWDGARIGMTPEQVRRAFPAAKPVENGESLLDNAKELLKLSDVRLSTGDRATASFYFRGDSLNEIKFVADVPAGQTQANLKRAEAIANSLVPIFGKPSTCGPRQGLLAFECDWVHGGLSVSVTYMDVAGEAPLLETTIRGIVASDAQIPKQPLAPKAPADQPTGPGGG